MTLQANPAVFSTIVDLGPDEPADIRSSKVSNGRGEEVGWVHAPRARGVWQNAVVWRSGEATPLRPDHNGLASAAFAINGRGDVVGWAEFVPGAKQRAFLAADRLRDLGSLAGPDGHSVAFDVNDARQVVGTSEAPGGGKRAFLWQTGEMIDLGTLPGDTDSEAFAINARGDIVGTSYQRLCGGCVPRAVVWRDRVATDLNTLVAGAAEWHLTDGLEITDEGAVLGRGRLNGQTRYFRIE